jgi:Alkylmercury lyase
VTPALLFAFIAGAVATVNPCGWALLPAWFARRLNDAGSTAPVFAALRARQNFGGPARLAYRRAGPPVGGTDLRHAFAGWPELLREDPYAAERYDPGPARNKREQDMNKSTPSRGKPDEIVSWFDLAVVSDPLVVKALGALLTDWRMRKRWEDLPSAFRRLHRAILQGYLETGSAPSRENLGKRFGGVVGSGLDDLVARDLILLDGGEVAGAYPFTSRPSRNSVEIQGCEIAAMCAIDALGAGAMARRDAKVRSRCARCDAPVEIDVSGHGLAIGRVQPAGAPVWAGMEPVSGCAADTQCRTMLFFCDRAHLEAWRAANAPDGEGWCLTPAQALQVGAAIFRPFLAEIEKEERT